MEAAPPVPWFAWSLLPLTLAYVLIQNLMARERYFASQWLILLPVLYGLALMLLSPLMVKMAVVPVLPPGLNPKEKVDLLLKMAEKVNLAAMTRVIQTLGCSCLALFAVAAWFTWHKPANAVSDQGSAAAR
jgi:hypothetical protein